MSSNSSVNTPRGSGTPMSRISPEEFIRFGRAFAKGHHRHHAFRIKVHDAYDIAIKPLKALDVKAVALAVGQWIRKNPDKALMVVAIIVLPILSAVFAPALLGVIGFSAAGPVAGSIAAGIQAGIGSVAAGSLFAVLQSAAMGGFGVPIVCGVTWGVTSLVCWGAGALMAWWKKDGDADEAERDAQAVQLRKRD